MIDSKKIITALNENEFVKLALNHFQHQYNSIEIYRGFCNGLGVNPADVKALNQIPFLPIRFFKSHQIINEQSRATKVFESSGTTSQSTSKHFVSDLKIYESSILEGFRSFFGEPKDYFFLALLPNYLERQNSSLVYMVDYLMEQSGQKEKAFYLDDFQALNDKINELEKTGQKSILFGVSFALLDFGEAFKPQLKSTQIIETGGMKGRKKEITRQELHQLFYDYYGNKVEVFSEYGMTELLSQAYWIDGKFYAPPWMRIQLREPEDPLNSSEKIRSGAINVIDLANVNSCSFIATDDLGKMNQDGTFKVLGRLDESDIRGCNLLII